jgi:flavin reductase (DIM6/NTAB) family NADH-FMN oxidoreductase RutF
MDQKAKQKVMRLVTNGMYVLTSRSGDNYGAATITWVSQASFKPPLVMAALRKDGNVFQCLSESKVAVLHVLASDQQQLAQKFFAKTSYSEGHLNGEPFSAGRNSAPVLTALRAYLECSVVEVSDKHGDHALVVLEATEAVFRGELLPLTVTDSPWEYGG